MVLTPPAIRGLAGISGRVTLVTGGGRGIGRSIAETLQRNGARVVVGDLELSAQAEFLELQLDVADQASVEEGFTRVEDEVGPVELLALNAGVFELASLAETALEHWRRTLEVNLTGAFLCAQRALPSMRKGGYGRVVVLGSSAGRTGGSKEVSAYAASKAGAMSFARSIAREYGPDGVTANAVAPAPIDTAMIANLRNLEDRIPIGRLGRPQDVADLVCFLLSAHAGYIRAQ